VQAGL
jgi:hypothetical protein